MITGGNATLYVSSVSASVKFYTEVLALKLIAHYDEHWATVRAGETLTLGLDPRGNNGPPGAKGTIEIGLEIDEPIGNAVQRLTAAGVRFDGEVKRTPNGNFVSFHDPDGNPLYLWETVKWD
ncbi:MAG TPA: VOC family protein [Acidobacteriaceae bacterium]|nr:VOC family protein [Acidobacteriaceae bacterium]